jgi:LCP family protein required for cell wall assembly
VVVVLLAALTGGLFFGWRVVSFLQTFNLGNPIQEAQNELNPPAGSVAWKIANGKEVNLLLLGYGGAENDAPYLTDTLMIVRIDPNTHRAIMVSIPRDLQVRICAYVNGSCDTGKINSAYSIGMLDQNYWGKKPEFSGSSNKDRGGNLAIQTVEQVTGLHLDGYVGVDFKAFRDIVDALGGIEVHMDTPLHDCHYPDYHNGYFNGGVPLGYPCPSPRAGLSFLAGTYTVNGEQALELARSRDADQPEQANDFGRIKRQQMIMAAIRKKAISLNAITKAGGLMDALQKDFATNLTLTDLRALYSWSRNLSDSALGHVSIDLTNFLYECPSDTYYECPTDSSYGMLHAYFASLLVDPGVLKERAPIQIANASRSLAQMGDQVRAELAPLGFNMIDPVRLPVHQQSIVYDNSGGKDPQTVRWLADHFHASVLTPKDGPPPTPNPPPGGVVLVLGRDFSLQWVGS